MYVFALVTQPVDLTLTGIAQGNVVFFGTGPVRAVVQPNLDLETELQAETQTLEAVLAHDRVIQTLFCHTTVLPLRFGTVFTTPQVLLEHLQARQDQYLNRIQTLRDQGEFTLSLSAQTAPTATVTGQGRDYFRAKKDQFTQVLRDQEQAQQEWDALVQGLHHHFHAQIQARTDRLFILVPRPHWEQLAPWLAQQTLNHWQYTLTGPGAPFHFV